MAITIDWSTFIINIPKNDLTLVQLVPTEIREMDINWFRLELKDIEDSEEGMPYPDTHKHNTEVTLGGITYARVVEILDPYSIIFEDGQYAVNLIGANSNIGDKVNVNQVSIRSNNSAGLTAPLSVTDISHAVWEEQLSGHTTTGSAGKTLATAGSGGVDYQLLANAVWDEQLSGHTSKGSAGKTVILTQYGDKIWLDLTTSNTGTIYPVGTQKYPVNNIINLLQISTNENINQLFIKGNIPINIDVSNHIINSDSFIDNGLVFSGNIFSEMIFENLNISGIGTFINSKFNNCFIENIQNISGEANNCRLSNYISIESGSTFSGVELVIEGDNTIVDLQNEPCTASFDVNSGIITFINAVAGSLIELNLRGGEIILDASCTGGDFYAEGIGTLYNGSTMTIKDNHLLALEPIADYVWNKTLP